MGMDMDMDMMVRNAGVYVAISKKGISMESDPIDFAAKLQFRWYISNCILFVILICLSSLASAQTSPLNWTINTCEPTGTPSHIKGAFYARYFNSWGTGSTAQSFCFGAYAESAQGACDDVRSQFISVFPSSIAQADMNFSHVSPASRSCGSYSLLLQLRAPKIETITLQGDASSVEPWHKKPLHDPDHLKSNLPYKAIVKDQNGQLKAGINVTITTEVTSNSGGHIHTAGRHKGKLVAGTVASTKDGIIEIKGKTNGSGVFEFTFGAEEASGTHTLTAKCDTGCLAPATATVDVGIKGLLLLDYGDGKNYTLTGHQNPDPHPGSHYYSPAALVKIINLAHRYRNEFNQPEYKENFVVPLLINDSSLIKGGTFDVLQDWTSESNVHGGHRQGVVVDINGIKKESLAFKEFAKDCCQITARWHKRGTAPHYHLLLLGEDK